MPESINKQQLTPEKTGLTEEQIMLLGRIIELASEITDEEIRNFFDTIPEDIRSYDDFEQDPEKRSKASKIVVFTKLTSHELDVFTKLYLEDESTVYYPGLHDIKGMYSLYVGYTKLQKTN